MQEKKFIDELFFDDYEVLTPEGFKDFGGIAKTIEFQEYIIRFKDLDRPFKCADTHILIDTNNQQIYARDLKPGDLLLSPVSDKGYLEVLEIEASPVYSNMYDLLGVDGGIYNTDSIVSHNSTITAGVALHYALFNSNYKIGILANKDDLAQELLGKVTLAYENLPHFLQHGIRSISKHEIVLENRSVIFARPTSKSAVRGKSINCVSGNNYVTIKDKYSGEIKKITIEELENKNDWHKFYIRKQLGGIDEDILINDRYEVLTDDGFKDFYGISIDRNKTIVLKTEFCSLSCTGDHEIYYDKNKKKPARDFIIGDTIFTSNGIQYITDIINSKTIEKVYDLVQVKSVNSFYCNDIKVSNCLLLDEFAHVENNISEEFYASTFPTISSGKTTKLIIISTPNKYNLFHKLYTDALAGRNGFNPVTIKWNEVEGRDESWKKEQIANSSEEIFAQEHECRFESSTRGLINGEKIKQMMEAYENPIKTDENNKLNIYEDPIKGETYLIVVDTAKGVGYDYTAFHVIKISKTPYKVVATYRCNDISYLIVPEVINKIGRNYNEAWVLIEINEYGFSVGTSLAIDDNYQYPNIIWTFTAQNKQRISYGNDGKSIPGLKTTEATKTIGCANLKALIENDKLIIKDYNTISELSNFVKVKNTYKADDGKNDDLVAGLWLFGWLTTQDFFRDIEQNVVAEINDIYGNEITTMITAVGFINSFGSNDYDVENNISAVEADDKFDDEYLWERAKDLDAVNMSDEYDNKSQGFFDFDYL